MTIKKYFKSSLRSTCRGTYYILTTSNVYYRVRKRNNRTTYEKVLKSTLPKTLTELSNVNYIKKEIN